MLKKVLFTHREMDYNRVTGRLREWHFVLKRGNVLSQIVDRTKWYLAPKFFHVVHFPTHVDIEVSVSCQMRCPMCLRKTMPKNLKSGAMDFELYKKIIDECSQRGVFSVKLSWRGEPLLNPNIARMVKYAKDKGIKDVAFLTNGERLNPDLTNQLIEAGLDWISISIDGLGETYERIRYPETFEGITDKVKFLKECRDSKGLKKPLIRLQTIWGAVKDNPEEYYNYWENLADKVYIIADQIRADLFPFPKEPNHICLEPWRRITIGWNGVVAQCIGDYDELVILGDVKKQSIYEIWHGEKFNKLRESIKTKRLFTNKPCTTCHDPGVMYEEIIKIGNKKVKLGLYKDQVIDVTKIDARPHLIGE